MTLDEYYSIKADVERELNNPDFGSYVGSPMKPMKPMKTQKIPKAQKPKAKYVRSTNRLDFDPSWLETFKSKFVVSSSGCWEWTGCHQKPVNAQLPYGITCVRYLDGDFSQAQTHRVSWYVYHGAIPMGLMVLHRCSNPGCGNPDHLYLGTAKDNHLDCVRDGTFKHASTKGMKIITRDLKAKVVARMIELGFETATNRQKSAIRNQLQDEFGLNREQLIGAWRTRSKAYLSSVPGPGKGNGTRCSYDSVEYPSIYKCRKATGKGWNSLIADPLFKLL